MTAAGMEGSHVVKGKIKNKLIFSCLEQLLLHNITYIALIPKQLSTCVMKIPRHIENSRLTRPGIEPWTTEMATPRRQVCNVVKFIGSCTLHQIRLGKVRALKGGVLAKLQAHRTFQLYISKQTGGKIFKAFLTKH